MTILKASCGSCKNVIEGQIYTDYDNLVLCRACYLNNEIRYEEECYLEKREWLKNTHIKDLKNMRAKIIKLKLKAQEE